MSDKEEKTENLFQKIGTNLKKELNHRTKSNVIASYIITWIILDWKSIIYLIFSSDSINIKLANNYTQPTWGTFLCPFIGVGIYLLLVPILESTINITSNWITRPINNKIREQQYELKIADIEDEIQIEVERNKIFEEMSNESELERLTKSNSFFEKKIDELNTLVESKDVTINNLSNEIKQINNQPSIQVSLPTLNMKLRISFPGVLNKFKLLFATKNIANRSEISDEEAEVMITQNLIVLDNESNTYNLTGRGKTFRDYLKSK